MTKKNKTSGWYKFTNSLYSIGAAIVILGALAKLTHFQLQGIPIGNLLLTIGLVTEAIIFFISAFEKVPKQYEWDIVYPELAQGEERIPQKPQARLDAEGLGQLNKFFQHTHFDNESIEKLGAGLQNLSSTATKLNDISDASVATNNYVQSIKQASSSMEEFSKVNENGLKVYSQLTQSLGNETVKISEKTNVYYKSLDFLHKKIEDLNNSYEKHLKNVNTRFTDFDSSSEKMDQILNDLNTSVENMKIFKSQTDQLSKNLTSLNQVYSNMLSAMNTNTKKG